LHQTNTFQGDAGNDTLTGEGFLIGGDGDDILVTHGFFGSAHEQSLLLGGKGNDSLFLLTDTASLYGDDGDDTLYGGDYLSYLVGGVGDDTFVGGTGVDVAFGEQGRDVLQGNAANDQLSGGEDDDKLSGGDGRDLLIGGEGNDEIEGGTDRNFLVGEAGDDIYLRNDTGADDIILDTAGTNVLRFGDGIVKETLTFRTGKDASGNSYLIVENFRAAVRLRSPAA
jgi:Ca2+-binding RTX toxin-like protein